jgi:hypothetical protein
MQGMLAVNVVVSLLFTIEQRERKTIELVTLILNLLVFGMTQPFIQPFQRQNDYCIIVMDIPGPLIEYAPNTQICYNYLDASRSLVLD